MAQTAIHLSNAPDAVGEIVTDASVEALNAALAQRGIDPAQIISILPVAAKTLVTIAPEKFRVLYRLAA
jgi:hypothetical protein